MDFVQFYSNTIHILTVSPSHIHKNNLGRRETPLFYSPIFAYFGLVGEELVGEGVLLELSAVGGPSAVGCRERE